jgi:hypothetical protein
MRLGQRRITNKPSTTKTAGIKPMQSRIVVSADEGKRMEAVQAL